MSRWADRLYPWILPMILLIVWGVAGDLGALPRHFLPTPRAVAATAIKLIQSGELWRHLTVSCGRASLGFLAGGGVGFALGVVTGSSVVADRFLDTSVQMLRTIPHLALIPLVILWFGIGEWSKIFLVAIGVLFPIYVNTHHGLRMVDPALLEMGRVYGLNSWQLFRQVRLPSALPAILVGVRYALGVMWLTLIAAETISSASGIGYLTIHAREFLQTDVILLCILVYSALGKSADSIARSIEKFCLPWHPAFVKDREGAKE